MSGRKRDLNVRGAFLHMAADVIGTWGLLRDSVRLTLDAVPEGIPIEKVRAHLRALPGVVQVHDLHIWGMSTTETALTAHVVMPGARRGDAFIAEVCGVLRREFFIGHATIQIDTDPAHACELAPDSVV
jgi:cobalt-zinc-cadmium efflux system protein